MIVFHRRMATKADDNIEETTFSTITAATKVKDDRAVLCSGDEIMNSGEPRSSTDDDSPPQPAPLHNSGRGSTRSSTRGSGRGSIRSSTRGSGRTRFINTYNIDGIARVKAEKNAKDEAAGKLMKFSKKSKFIIVVNNMTDHDLVRSASSGGDSWPFSSIKKNECVAALYVHSHFNNLNVVFTAADDKPGIRTVMLYAHWPLVGNRDIGIYAGKTECANPWYKINWQKVHDCDRELNGNKAAVNNPGKHYLFEYDIQQLEYAQFGVVAEKEAATEAVQRFTTFCTGSMPSFTFVVNNLTGCDLTLSEKHEVQGRWPLGNIKKGECAVAGFNQQNMSLAAHYSACVDQQKKSVSLAGSWPVMGNRKIYAGESMKAKDAWKRLSERFHNWPVQKGADDRHNSAYIQVVKGNSRKS